MNERQLWSVALATYGVGDVVTTHVGMGLDGIEESHPISGEILAASGTGGMVATKVLVFGVALVAYRAAPTEYQIGIPLGLALLGTAIVANNLSTISAAVSAGGSP